MKIRLIFFTIVFLVAISSQALAVTEVLVEPIEPVNIQPGNEFSVNLNISEGDAINSFEFSVFFNPQVIEAIAVKEQSYLSSAGPTTFNPGIISNDRGSVTSIRNSITDGRAKSGDGTAVTIRFKAKSMGSSQIRISEPKLFAKGGQQIGSAQGVSSNITIVNAPPTASNDPSQSVTTIEGQNPISPGTQAEAETRTSSGQAVSVGPRVWIDLFRTYWDQISKNNTFFLFLGAILVILFIFVAFRTRH